MKVTVVRGSKPFHEGEGNKEEHGDQVDQSCNHAHALGSNRKGGKKSSQGSVFQISFLFAEKNNGKEEVMIER